MSTHEGSESEVYDTRPETDTIISRRWTCEPAEDSV
jgi:hypothetical protein